MKIIQLFNNAIVRFFSSLFITFKNIAERAAKDLLINVVKKEIHQQKYYCNTSKH